MVNSCYLISSITHVHQPHNTQSYNSENTITVWKKSHKLILT